MKKILLVIGLVLIANFATACGERNVKLVDKINSNEIQMVKSNCSKVMVPANDENLVLVEKKDIKVTKDQAEKILEDYLKETYQDKVILSGADHVGVPGHEDHDHKRGNLQDSHGTISYAFLVESITDEFYKGKFKEKPVPMYVDAKTGDIYGLGCGLGAGAVVFKPDLDKYLYANFEGKHKLDHIKEKGHMHEDGKLHGHEAGKIIEKRKENENSFNLIENLINFLGWKK